MQNEKLKKLKKDNENYKTANIDGLLFLVNDSSKELDYHFYDNIDVDVNTVKNILTKRNDILKLMNITYIFNIVPDKPCILREKLEAFFDIQLKRPHANELKNLDFCVDTYSCIDNSIKIYKNFDTHINSYGAYLMYSSIIKKLNYEPKPIEITYNKDIIGDLLGELNNGTRKYDNLIDDDVPNITFESFNYENKHIISLDSNNLLSNDNVTKKTYNNYDKVQIYFNPDCDFEKFAMDYYYNPNSENDLKVLYFHDSNMMIIDQNILSPKEYFCYHFKHNYFYKGVFKMEILNKIKPDIVIEESMERFLNVYRH